jgi:hypothetical protein
VGVDGVVVGVVELPGTVVRVVNVLVGTDAVVLVVVLLGLAVLVLGLLLHGRHWLYQVFEKVQHDPETQVVPPDQPCLGKA